MSDESKVCDWCPNHAAYTISAGKTEGKLTLCRPCYYLWCDNE